MKLTAIKTKNGLLAALVVLYTGPSLATEPSPPATIPNIFTTGDVIRASDMNDNFSAVLDAVNNVELTPGAQGIPGATGARGPAGANGARGSTGAVGAPGLTGPAGANGAQGLTGAAGVDGIDGAVGMKWRGDWSAGTTYVVGDAVAYAGGSYISIQDTSGVEDPSDISYWEVLAERGNDGADGVQGIAGAQGATGAQGPAGADGAQGLAGAPGIPGANGAQGDIGPIGLTGATGAQGADGTQGPAGATGAAGPAGAVSLVWLGAYTNTTNYAINDAVSFNGSAFINIQDTNGTQDPTDTNYWELLASKGADGVQGVAGNDGAPGLQGSIGLTGAQGAAGAQGIPGNNGADGAVGATGAAGVQGPVGPAGAVGETGPEGPTGPASLVWQGAYVTATNYAVNDSVGFDGGSYINIQATDGTQDPTDTSYWELLAGKGADGVQGIAGNDGAVGAQGPIGVTGAQGPAGATGSMGPAGTQGPAGTAGVDGSNGIDGIDGFDGLDGDDAPDRTADLCALYQNLSDSSLIPGLTIPTYCFTVYAVGDVGPAGGIVFYITDGGVHGLESAPTDQSNAVWGCFGTVVPGADGVLIGTGAQNTADILAAGCGAGVAAEIADAYLGPDGTTVGWFLPSRDELNLMYTELRLNASGGFANANYWSSSEFGIFNAWHQNFTNGNQFDNNKDITLRVRAVRAF